MGTITTGTGLISGIDIEGTVEKLMAIERRPVTLLQNQAKKIATEKSAFQTLSAQILALKLVVTPFKAGVTFRPNKAESSNENVLTAKASSAAIPGQYSFSVRQTAQTHQMISQGFGDSDRTAIGAGTIRIGMGPSNLDRDLGLNVLRNGQGIRRGQIRITDRSGASADIDLSSVTTVSDILKKINEATGISVKASVSGDQFVIQDTSGSTAHNLVVQDINGGYTAADLGLAANVADTKITGSDVLCLTNTTALSLLNDGNGIRTNGFGDDMQFTLRDGSSFSVDLNTVSMDSSLGILNNGQGVRAGSIKITNRASVSATIDLSGAKTLNDVATAINGAGLGLQVTLVGGTKLLLTDSSGGTKNLTVEEVNGGSTAADLGLVGSVEASSISGKEIYRLSTLGDVKRAIEDAAHRASNPDKLSVNISADGTGLMIADTTGGSGNLVISSLLNSKAAEDLGIAGTHSTSALTGKRLVAGLNTVLLRSLNGGSGVAGGIIEIQNRSGTAKQIDLTSAQTLDEVLNAINNAGIGVEASLNQNRTGIILKDTTGSTATNLKISDVNSTTAHDLKIAVDAATSQVDTGNNQLQYVSESTLLSKLNGGRGISAGTFSITDSSGRRTAITLTANDVAQKTVGDLLSTIRTQTGGSVVATINAAGNGILLTDAAGGGSKLTVSNEGTSTTASELNIAKQADTAGTGTIDGASEYQITVGGSDTLQTLADKINAMKGPFTATIINDGSGTNSYRLSLTSKYSGKAGKLTFDGGLTSLGMYDLVDPRDAIISLGGSTGGDSVIASSSTNTFTGLVPGLTLEARGVSSSPVTVTVSQDVAAVTEKITAFVEKYNAIIDTIKEQTKYNSETEEAGPLLGDYNVSTIQSQLYGAITNTVMFSGDVRRLSDLGLTVGSGGQLTFDEAKFQAAYAKNATAVENFFSTKDKGFGYVIDKLTDRFTESGTGIITRVTATYDERTENINDRITFLNDLLEKKQERLYRSFQNMETALAKLQTMQTALSSMTIIEPITRSGSSS